MAITFVCSNSSCGKRFKVADKLGGKRVRCPACKTVQVVPSGDPDVVDLASERLAEKKTTITLVCSDPSCGKKLEAPAEAAGKTIQCPICKSLQVVPSSDVPDSDDAGLSLHDLKELADGQEVPTDTTGRVKAQRAAFLSGCGAAALYGLGSFSTCFRMILVASGFNLLVLLVLAVIALVSGGGQGGAVLAMIVMNLGNWLLAAFFLRFHMNVVLSSVEGTDLTPALPRFDLRELFLMALKGLGISVVYILPVVTIPLLALGWLALAYCNDDRAFDLLWAVRAAVKRPGQLLLLWLILAGYLLLGGLALIALALVGGMVVAPATAWCAEHLGVGLAVVAWIAMLIPVVLLLLATLLMLVCILFRCVGMLGRHNPELLRSLPEDRNRAKAMCFVIVGVVLSVGVNFLLAPPAARSLGGAVGGVFGRLRPPGLSPTGVQQLITQIKALINEGRLREAEAKLDEVKGRGDALSPEDREAIREAERLLRAEKARVAAEEARRRREIRAAIGKRMKEIEKLVSKDDVLQAEEELVNLEKDYPAELSSEDRQKIEKIRNDINAWFKPLPDKIRKAIKEAEAAVAEAKKPVAVENKKIQANRKKKSLDHAEARLGELEKGNLSRILSDPRVPDGERFRKMFNEKREPLREGLDRLNERWGDLQIRIKGLETLLAKRKGSSAPDRANTKLAELKEEHRQEKEIIRHFSKRIEEATLTALLAGIKLLADKKDVSWQELIQASTEMASLEKKHPQLGETYPELANKIDPLKGDILKRLTANIEELLQVPTFELIMKHRAVLLGNPMLEPAVKLTLEKYRGKPVGRPIERHVGLALHTEALRRVKRTAKWYKRKRPLAELVLKYTEGLMTRKAAAKEVGNAAALAAALAAKSDLNVANDPRYKKAKEYRSIVWDPPGWHSVPVVELLTKRFVSHCPVVKMPERGQMNVGADFEPCTEVKSKNDAAHKAFRDRHFKAFRAYAAENFPAAKRVELAKQVGPVRYECIRGVTVRKGGGWVMVGIIRGRSVVFWFGGTDIRPFHQTLNNVRMVDIEGKVAAPAGGKKEGR